LAEHAYMVIKKWGTAYRFRLHFPAIEAIDNAVVPTRTDPEVYDPGGVLLLDTPVDV
jgi:hypothetical protein